MNKKLFIIFIFSIFILASGCSQYGNFQGPLKNSYFQDLENIVLYKDINYKKVSDNDNMDEIVSILEKIEGEKIDISTLKESDFIDIPLKIEFNYKDDDNKNKSISFVEDKMLYEDNWYKVDIDTEKLYDDIDSKEKIDSNGKVAKLMGEARKELSKEDALIGKWKYNYNDGSITIIEITNDEIVQEGRKFKYKINDYTENEIHLTVYSKNGFIDKGNKLFHMHILLDENNTNMIINKEMVGNEITYKNNLIFINEDDLELGNFESFFFIENREK
ncbi:hypothetical protein GOQ29_09665 [Clostridium sp. D2Q-14]|uniref:hypothetical protein n=1 Tax=Anaeromonas gelatinilytica TaxID=2683194 RepID=UPI00193C633B|nr:hypothetical protein [Anaeromonas gelatinilytica]MBS4535881.1 hypothetical protein [Anaeromonas gelatinilytica]